MTLDEFKALGHKTLRSACHVSHWRRKGHGKQKSATPNGTHNIWRHNDVETTDNDQQWMCMGPQSFKMRWRLKKPTCIPLSSDLNTRRKLQFMVSLTQPWMEHFVMPISMQLPKKKTNGETAEHTRGWHQHKELKGHTPVQLAEWVIENFTEKKIGPQLPKPETFNPND